MADAGGERVLVGVYGSAGDLFPLVPAIRDLAANGTEVRCLVPRALSLYCRALGIRSSVIGSGRELAAASHPDVLTAANDGWGSFSSLIIGYLVPELGDSVNRALAVIDDWQPTAVIATSLAVPVRLAALDRGVPVVTTNMYPTHIRHDPSGSPASALAGATLSLQSQLPARSVPPEEIWGWTDEIILHEPLLLGSTVTENSAFPYWDQLPGTEANTGRVIDWIASSTSPVVTVTGGSFIGQQLTDLWQQAASALHTAGLRGLFVGAPTDWNSGRDVPGILRSSYVPLSDVLPSSVAAIHHAGLGPSMAALRNGLASIAIPVAFDQPANAAAIERLGAGVVSSVSDLGTALAHALDDANMRRHAVEVSRHLADGRDATARIVARCLHTAERSAEPQPEGEAPC